jgi:hypothetical protein
MWVEASKSLAPVTHWQMALDRSHMDPILSLSRLGAATDFWRLYRMV